MRRACISVVLAGCFYNPGSYHDIAGPFPGKRVELACLDLAVTLTEDARAPSPVVEYSFGNHCTHSTVVDLASVPAIGRYADGEVRDLHPRDPKHELAALPIDAWWHGQEEISYEAADRGAPEVVCVDVGHVDRSGDASPHWVCMQ